MVVRRELLRGLGRLNATTTVLQRARLADPLGGMWEAADVQWWWRRPRATDELALPVWFDEVGPVRGPATSSRPQPRLVVRSANRRGWGSQGIRLGGMNQIAHLVGR